MVQQSGDPEISRNSSQGPGKPFGAGETIYEYQACEVYGQTFIGSDGNGSEYLCSISDGDKAVFRYVKSESGFPKAVLQISGKGKIRAILDGQPAGSIQTDNNGRHEIIFERLQKSEEVQESELEFSAPEDLKVISITLYE